MWIHKTRAGEAELPANFLAAQDPDFFQATPAPDFFPGGSGSDSWYCFSSGFGSGS